MDGGYGEVKCGIGLQLSGLIDFSTLMGVWTGSSRGAEGTHFC